MKRKMMIHREKITTVRNGKFVQVDDLRRVRVLAVAEGWAMVRRPGCMVYVCPVKELVPDDGSVEDRFTPYKPEKPAQSAKA